MITKLRFLLFVLIMLAAISSFAQAPNISYSTPQSMTVGFKIMQVKPSNSGGGVTGRYSVSPALPGGLIINGTTGIITGTPTVASPETNYTVTTSNSAGSNSAIINITVSPTPIYISYTTPQVFTTGAPITPLTPVNNTGGSFDGSFHTNPTLPAGLAIDTLSGVISGTPTVAGPATIYTVYYLFDGPGSPGDPDYNPPVIQSSPDSAKITITVNQGAVSNDASLSNYQVSNGTLSPVFATGTYNYTINVGNGLKTMTVTPTAAAASATIKVNGKAVTSGTPSGYLPLVVGANTVATVVTAQDGSTTKTYTLTINEARSSNDNLAGLKISASTLSPAFNLNTTSYTASVPYAISFITVTPTTADGTAAVTVNSKTVVSGSPSAAIALKEGANSISTVVTAQNGTTKTYTITITRAAPSTNCNLSALTVSKGTLTPAFATTTTSYTDMLTNGTTSVTVTPTGQVSTSTITVNGTAVMSGRASGPITLAVGSNTVTVVVTAQDGATIKTYTVTVIRPSTNAKLANLTTNAGAITPVFNPAVTSYTLSVTAATASITVTPTVAVTGSTVKVNGAAVLSGYPSGAIALGVGTNTIDVVVTAQDGVTTNTYKLTVTRPAGLNIPDAEVSVQAPANKALFDEDVLIVHQGISPNGDGVNDFLVIDGILAYPDNKLSIMDRNGQLIYEAKGYDNSTKPFDGHSNKNGQMQLPGTYFYSLNYTVNGITKHKTGFLVLKY